MDAELHKLGLRLKFFYSMGGLVLGGGCILGGCILFMGGIFGRTSWTFELLGVANTSITDAAPGAILFVVGIFFVLITKFSITHERIKYESADPPPGERIDLERDSEILGQGWRVPEA